MEVFITGGTGLVGRALVRALVARGDRVVVLSRRGAAAASGLPNGVEVVAGDPGKPGPWQQRLASVDGVVNLVGEGIFDHRWSAAHKARMRSSRIDSTRHVAEAIAAAAKRPRVLVSASAIGYYGLRCDEPSGEDAPAGTDFLAKLCVDWEAAAMAAPTRVATVRVGVVLAPDGGALAKMLAPFRLGVGGPIGDGRQWTSWIHRDDLVHACLHALVTPSIAGPVNGVAPTPVTNEELSHTLARQLHRPCLLRLPVFALRLALGEVASVAAGGQRVMPRVLLSGGFQFRFPSLDGALAACL